MTYTGKTFIDFAVTGKITRNLSCDGEGKIIVLDKPTFSNINSLEKFSGVIFTENLFLTAHETLLIKDCYIPVIYDIQQNIKFQNDEIITMFSVNGIGVISKGVEKVEVKKTHKIITKNYALTSTISGMKYYKNLKASMVATRGEFMFLTLLKEHPLKMLQNLKHKKIVELGILNILQYASENFEKVVYRLSDFSSDNMQHLSEFHKLEQVESNPIVGNRGAYRLLHSHLPLLQFEIEIIKNLNRENISFLIPFVRTIDEATAITNIIHSKMGSKVQIGCMIEVPQIMQFPEKLSSLFDFFVVGTKDLSQLLSGLDRQFLNITTDTEWLITYLLDMLFLSKISKEKEIYITSRNIYNNLSKKYINNIYCLDD